ncbi:MAG: SHOCT domain-containing protein [Dehalococcoidia bacterium]
MWWGVHDGMGWWMLSWGVGMVLFWGVVIALVGWGIRTLVSYKDKPVKRESPGEIARRRYASGEITKEQFEEINATLNARTG